MSNIFARFKPLTPDLSRTNYPLALDFIPGTCCPVLTTRRLFPRFIKTVKPSNKFHVKS